MKNRFTTLDLVAILPEIQEKLVGNRVYQVYDIDNKTFLVRFTKPTGRQQEDNKKVEESETLKQQLIIESGIRIHLTEYDWPKSSTPSGFTMKLRKHLKNKRLEFIRQLGNDRIVDMQFGTNEFANHIILELFSKGNIILTDKDYVILSLIRIYKDVKTNINIGVREKYPLNKEEYVAGQAMISRAKILKILQDSKDNNFKKLFNPHFLYGPNLLEHSLLQFKDINANKFKVTSEDIDLLEKIFNYAEMLAEEMRTKPSKGYLLVKQEKRANSDDIIKINDEFHPYLFKQYTNNNENIEEYETFNKAVDIFFSGIESQKIETKVLQQEKQAMKKLESIKKDHESRLENLVKLQQIDNKKAYMIENNIELVESATAVLRSAIANKYSWEMIWEMVRDAQDSGDPIASRIKELKLEKNCFTMLLQNPYEEDGETMMVDIDIDLSAHANARKYYVNRKDAAKKEQKTLDQSEKIFKNVERKVKQQLKETTIKTTIVMAKKTLWFEKFFWFISSENYLIIAGRDAQQNEMIVKRYMDKNDIYVHADIHGATSVVIKNHKTDTAEISPKTINEAANMAVCYSASWDAKVVSAAYWVYSHQVQKTAPTGQYLSVGSFMIRGKKNYIPLQNLILGFGILFRIDDESLERRQQQIPVANDKENVPNESPIKKTEKDGVEDGDESSKFPDTTIKYKNILDEIISSKSQTNDDSDYTIVNTGENVKKKVKIITQKNLQKGVKNTNKKNNKQAKNNPKINAKYNISGHEVDQTKTEQEEEEEKAGGVSQDSKEEAQDSNEINAETNKDDDDDEEEETKEPEVEDDDEEEEETSAKSGSSESQRIISSLISNPLPEDNLLYAIPVCGPYNSLQSYKYKIKIIPGTMRRGKASKTALMMFLKEKSASDRERDLLKAMKDQDIAKNMPAKVKIVARIQK